MSDTPKSKDANACTIALCDVLEPYDLECVRTDCNK